MMSTKIYRYQWNGLVIKRLMSSQTAAKRAESEPLRTQELKTTTLTNGLTVTSLENHSPITRIGVFIRAGSRYEGNGQLGATHTIRSLAGFTTQESTVMEITRNIEYLGASLSALTTRDYMIYLLENNRDDTDDNIKYVADTVLRPAFKGWQLKENLNRQKTDLAILKNSPQLLLSEALHSTAFRGGLRNSLYSPEFMIKKHSTEMLLDFVDHHFVSNRTAIVGIGIEHNQLLEKIEKHFGQMARGDRAQSGQSKYIGGQVRVDSDLDTTYVAIATEGAGLKNQKDVLALSLLQTILGTGPQTEFSDYSKTRLGAAVAKATDKAFAVSAFNVNYEDTGLFGISVAASPDHIDKAVKAAVNQMRDSAKNINEEDLKNAKHCLKASTLITNEDPNVLIEEIGTQSLSLGQVLSLSDFEKAVDSISAQDVSALAAKLIKGKGAMASVGKTQNVPYLEDLV